MGVSTPGAGLPRPNTDRQIEEQPDGSWNVWCRKHGRKYTMTAVSTQHEARMWWREHTGDAKGRAMCPQPHTPGPPLEFPE